MANTTKFFDRIIVAFLRRHSPASSRPKPAFMKNTRNAVRMVQAVSAPIFSSAVVMGVGGARRPGHSWHGARFARVSARSTDGFQPGGCEAPDLPAVTV